MFPPAATRSAAEAVRAADEAGCFREVAVSGKCLLLRMLERARAFPARQRRTVVSREQRPRRFPVTDELSRQRFIATAKTGNRRRGYACSLERLDDYRVLGSIGGQERE